MYINFISHIGIRTRRRECVMHCKSTMRATKLPVNSSKSPLLTLKEKDQDNVKE